MTHDEKICRIEKNLLGIFYILAIVAIIAILWDLFDKTDAKWDCVTDTNIMVCFVDESMAERYMQGDINVSFLTNKIL